MLNEVSIEILRACPNNCLHCSSLSHSSCHEKIEYTKFAEVVSDAAKLGANTICLSGGEPFLHNDIVQMVKHIAKHNMTCYIYTSGIVFNSLGEFSSLSEKLLREISDYPIKLIFNIEAATEKTYNKIMGTECCFALMQHSVKIAVELGINAEAHFVPMILNIDEIPSTIRLCEDLGISRLSFLRLVLHGRAEQNSSQIDLNNAEYISLKTNLQDLQHSSRVPIRIGVPLSTEYSCCNCEAANGKLNIKYNGEVYPCEVFKNGKCGSQLSGLLPDNIYEKSLYDIYHNSKYLHFVRKQSLLFSTMDTDACESCVGQYLIRLEEKGGQQA